MNKNKDISFVASRYKRGRFVVNKGWKRLNIAQSFHLKRIRIAAVIASILVLSATAAIIYNQVSIPETTVKVPQTTVSNPKEVVKVIDFENAPLTVVITKIKEVYGVEVTNVPKNPDEYSLSLHYEGNPVDLIETINDILNTNMKIKE